MTTNWASSAPRKPGIPAKIVLMAIAMTPTIKVGTKAPRNINVSELF
jgi:hypothetical protein